ncbi:MAG TPA: hypothetical protein VGO40_21600 [Longimicrobium sp.]|nr:hypothetical protein [Longimicrobium sp.]
MTGGWLGWTDGRLRLVADGAGVVAEPVGDLPRERLGEVGFAVGRTWQLLLPGAGPPRLLVSNDGAGWTALPPPPVRGPASVGLHPDSGRVAVVEAGWLHAWELAGGWRTLPLPGGAVWVGEGTDGEWWAVGSRPSRRVRGSDREAAAWRGAGGEWTSVAVRPSWCDAYRAIESGGFETLQAADARAEPVVLASECAWFLEDPSWFLFTSRGDGRFAVQRLAGRVLVRLHRCTGGRPVAVTADGELWDWNGRRWDERGSAAGLREIGHRRAPYRAHLAPGDPSIYGVHVQTRDGREVRTPVRSEDRGASWEAVDLAGALAVAAWSAPPRATTPDAGAAP